MTRLKQFFSRKRLYTDLDEEIAFHLEQRVEELPSSLMGLPSQSATASVWTRTTTDSPGRKR